MIDYHFDPQPANLPHASAMTFQADLIFILKLVVAVSPCNIALKECEVDNSSKLGFVLVGYTFKSFTAEDLAFCFSVCNTDLSCQSLNYNLAAKSCELNSESRKSQLDNFHGTHFMFTLIILTEVRINFKVMS